MVRRYFSIIVFALLSTAIVRWTDTVEPSSGQSRAPAAENPFLRLELLETLDQIVWAEHEYKKINGHFTKLLSRIPYAIPASVADSIAFSVHESGNRFVISASSEENGQVRDQVTIDQNYKLQANFPLPAPRPEYLRSQTFRHMEKIKTTGRLEHRVESIFQGYFSFGIVDDAQKAAVVAKGIRSPVLGMTVELPMEMKENRNAGNLLSEVIHKFPRIGVYQTGENPNRHGRLTRNADLVVEPIE